MKFKKINFKSESVVYFVSLIIIFFIAVIFIFWYAFLIDTKLVWTTTVIRPQLNYRQLDGVATTKEKADKKPIAIMVENHTESRPLVGINKASIVYESIVEGDITRLLVIFDGSLDFGTVGPVRSARPFFIALARQWDPVYLHAGGSPEALSILTNSQMESINEISSDGIYFWRDYKRYAPHNLFTSSEKVKYALKDKEISTQASFTPWKFKSGSPVTAGEDITEIEILFNNHPNYSVKFVYQKATNRYERYIAGKPEILADGSNVYANNVVVMHTTAYAKDNYGRLAVDTKTGGKAEIYLDGKKIQGNWKSQQGMLIFYDDKNQEIKFNRGMIWIALQF